VTSKCKS